MQNVLYQVDKEIEGNTELNSIQEIFIGCLLWANTGDTE